MTARPTNISYGGANQNVVNINASIVIGKKNPSPLNEKTGFFLFNLKSGIFTVSGCFV